MVQVSMLPTGVVPLSNVKEPSTWIAPAPTVELDSAKSERSVPMGNCAKVNLGKAIITVIEASREKSADKTEILFSLAAILG